MRIESKQWIIKTLTIPLFSHTFSITKQSQKITIHKPKITNTEIFEYTCLNKNNYNRYSSTTSCLGVWWLWIRWGIVGVSIRGWRKCWVRNVHQMMLHLHRLCTGFLGLVGAVVVRREESEWGSVMAMVVKGEESEWVSESGRGLREAWAEIREWGWGGTEGGVSYYWKNKGLKVSYSYIYRGFCNLRVTRLYPGRVLDFFYKTRTRFEFFKKKTHIRPYS